MTQPAECEHGAISIIVALLMVALLGFAAIAIDVARLYSERAQLQNGSDAAALMLGQKCAKNTSDPECSATSPMAADFANKNAVDGLSNVKSIALDKPNRTVTVTTGAKEVGGSPNAVSTLFARALGIQSVEVSATSSVQWGTPSRGTPILPLAIAECKFNLNSGTQVSTEQVLEFGHGCGSVPGGFGWIVDGDPLCSVTISVGQASNSGTWFSLDPGASAPAPCTNNDLSKMNDQTVLLPLYDWATGTGSGARYYVKGFAAFHVTGYNFASIGWTSDGSIPNKSIRGFFVRFVSLSQALELGAAPDYGTSIARLTIGGP
jgi:Flp pilus assembly protein TadG